MRQVFDDGSGDANYGSSLYCSWLIKPTNAKFINLKFTSFSTEYNYDFVKIYKGDSKSSPLLGSFSGSVTPPSLNVESPSLYIEFVTDGSQLNQSGMPVSQVKQSNQRR
ncbi:MAG: CUB domain-containing protein [Saprospiraceae bacterium]|nr:CUB domain-containing protein [Saprospiraceae bacterium]